MPTRLPSVTIQQEHVSYKLLLTNTAGIGVWSRLELFLGDLNSLSISL